MHIEEKVVGDVVVLRPLGKIILGDDDKVWEKAREVLAKGHKKILLSLVDVPYVDYAGLGTLVRIYSMASKQEAKLKFSNLSKKVRDLFALTKLLTVFEVFDSEEEAIEAFDLPF